MEKLGRWVVKNYKKIILITLLITAYSIYESSKLEIKMDITDLLPKNDQIVVDYNYALDNYDSLDTTIVGVKGKREDIIKFMEEVAPTVKDIKYVKNVRYKIENDYLLKNSLLLGKVSDLEKQERSLTADSLEEFIAGINDNFEEVYVTGGDSDKVEENSKELIYFFNYIEDFLKGVKGNGIDESLAGRYFTGDKYFISPDNDLGMFTVKSSVTINEVDKLTKFVNELEETLVNKGLDYGVDVVLTGPQVLSRDEMVQTEKDTKLTTTLSMILVLFLFYRAFKYLRYSLLSVVPLTLGIIISLALTNIFFGKLNMMTAMMGAILIGLGIDYAIHIITIYFEYRDMDYTQEDSIMMVFKKGMKGIVSGSLTTSVGFLLFGVSSFPGFSEFGIVLGSGILVVLLLSMFFLPSLLMVFGRKKRRKKGNNGIGLKHFDMLENIVINRKKTTLVIVTGLILFLGYNARYIEFDKDMMNIEMKGLASLKLNDEIIEKFDMSSDNTIAFSSSLEESFELKEKLDDLKTVGEIESISMYLPPRKRQAENIEFIKKIKKELPQNSSDEMDMNSLQEELYRLEANIIEISDLSYMGGEIKVADRADKLIDSGIIGDLADNIEEYRNNLLKNQKTFIDEFLGIVKNVREDYIGIEDLTENIKNDYIGKDGRFLTTIYPKGDFWNADFQKLHVAELNTLNENLTGTTLMFLKVVDAEIVEGRRVLIYTFIGIYLILLLDMRSIKYSVLTILPMFAAVASTFGFLSLLGFKLNLVNIIGIPLIVGIGVDDGVHIMHRYLIEKDIRPALHSTGRAVLMTTLTTIAAFGTMIFAKYRGFSTFGILLIAGVLFAYLYTIVFMVAMLSLMEKNSK